MALGRLRGRPSAGRTVCVLMSGGLDSAALVADYLGRGWRVWPLFVAGGLRWEKAELNSCRRFLRAVQAPGLMPLAVSRIEHADFYPRRHWARSGRAPGARAAWDSVYLDGRNALLFSVAGVLCSRRGIGRVALAIMKGNPFKDARPEFLRAMRRALELGLGRTIRLDAPYARVSKSALIRRFRGLPLKFTFSCIAPAGLRHCGRCTKCAERRGAFRSAGVPDLTEYAK